MNIEIEMNKSSLFNIHKMLFWFSRHSMFSQMKKKKIDYDFEIVCPKVSAKKSKKLHDSLALSESNNDIETAGSHSGFDVLIQPLKKLYGGDSNN